MSRLQAYHTKSRGRKRTPGGRSLRDYSRQRATRGQRLAAARTAPIVQHIVTHSAGALKGLDTELAIGAVTATTNTNGNMIVLNLIRPGTGSQNRVGRKVTMKSLRVRGTALVSIKPDGAGDTTNEVLRMTVVYDKQPSGTLPTFDTVFGRTDQAGLETCHVLDSLRYDNTGRFRVLRDTLLVSSGNDTPPAAGTDFSHSYLPFDEYIDLKGRETSFSGQSSPQTISDISSGALYLIFRVEVGSSDTVCGITDTSYARLRYYD